MKIYYDDICFDSDLEVQYYKFLKEAGLIFIYHPKKPIQLNSKNKYTPDFIVFMCDKIEIVETKGYSQFSFMKDNMTHNLMLEKTTDELLEFLYANGVDKELTKDKEIVYRKIKFLKGHGWVDFDFKNPNTLANQRKNKIVELNAEVKELKEKVKNFERYFSYLHKDKLTKPQREWKDRFEMEMLHNE